MKSKNVLMGLIVLFCFTGCRDELMTFENSPRGNFEALWYIIDRNYCFFDYKQIDWDSVYLKYSPRITENMSSESLFNLLGMMLEELKDGHVNLIASHDISRYWKWQEDYPANFDPKIQEKYLGNDYSIAGGMIYKILEDNIGYVYYGSFSDDVGEGTLSQIISRMAICKGMIIDVRDNGGGSLTNVERIASRFFNERTLIGYISHKIGPGHNDFSGLYPKYIESSPYVRYQKPVVILTNRGCYSATNEFVSIMKYAPQVTVVGDKTGGGSGLPFSSELPNGWSVRFSASPMFNAEKQHIEFGVDPDLEVMMSEADANKKIDTIIETARTIIEENSVVSQ
ncbi:S41 family peptidase [Seramator thermalis]|uniref:S41 family peptidase n=1 Tax=Seramator thermalis TaxID=2496270 RepID=UPI00101D337C|nr:S41 family peptidase [Seramator thermalis]